MSTSPSPQTSTQTQQSSLTQPLHHQPQLPVSTRLIGKVQDPNTKTITQWLGNLDHASSSNYTVVLHFTPAEHPYIQQFLKGKDVVEILSMEVVMIPTTSAPYFLLKGLAAWIPIVESYPSSAQEIMDTDNAQLFTNGPTQGGTVTPLSIPVIFENGVQDILKPQTQIGGSPRFAARCTLVPLPGLTATAGTGVYEIYVRTTLRALAAA